MLENFSTLNGQKLIKHIFISALIILTLSEQALAQQQFTASQLKEDLLFYKAKLEQYHPNIYLYASREKINLFFDSLYHAIRQPLSEAEFYQKITLSSDLIKDGHTLILPSNDFIEFHNTQSLFLPIQIGLINQKLYVKMDCSSTKQLEAGTIIDSINGVSSDTIIKNLLTRQVRDGENLSYAQWILDTYFREYYSYVFGHPNTYQISCTKGNDSYKIQMPALLKDSIYHYRQKNYPNFYAESTNNKGIYVNYNGSKKVAILTIKSFDTYALKSEYQQNFTKEIKNIFGEIIKNQIQHLVIDLRNNQGGDVENGVFLLKYLMAKPFTVVNEYYVVRNGTLTKSKGTSMGYQKPNKKHYKGQIYVLLNGGSFSNSVILSSCLKENTNTIFVGTESGGNPHVLAGNAKYFELPNTKIGVQVPVKRFVMTSLAKNNGSGLIPSYNVEDSIENNILQNDSQLDFLLNLIQQNGNKGGSQ